MAHFKAYGFLQTNQDSIRLFFINFSISGLTFPSKCPDRQRYFSLCSLTTSYWQYGLVHCSVMIENGLKLQQFLIRV